MRRVGIRELKARMSEIMNQVQGGESIEVTNHGRVVALLVPVRKEVEASERQAALTRLDVLAAEIANYTPGPTNVAELLGDMRR